MSRGGGPGLRRKSWSREPRSKFILFCEGKNTEPGYFAALRAMLKSTIIEIEIVRAAGVPTTIVKSAIERKKKRRIGRKSSFEDNDQIWAIFDRDEHPRVEEAIGVCVGAGVGLAYSNPCFEYWLILHEEEYGSPDDRFEMQKYYSKIRPEYDSRKGKCPDFCDVVRRVESAERRAKLGIEQRASEGCKLGAPCTTVYLLTEELRRAASSSK